MDLKLADIGLNQDELKQQVIDRIVDQVLYTTRHDEFGDDYLCESKLKMDLEGILKQRVDERIEEVFGDSITELITKMLTSIVFTKTNEWGEKNGESWTLKEYLAKRCTDYLQDRVNPRTGKKAAVHDRNTISRFDQLLEEKISDSLDYAAKNAVKQVVANLGDTVAGHVKRQVVEAASQVKVELK